MQQTQRCLVFRVVLQECSGDLHLGKRRKKEKGRVRGGEVKLVKGPRSCSALLTKAETLTSTLK